MTLYEWFDPYDYEHIRAYRYLERNGFWPEGYIPDHIAIGNLWQVEIGAKMAEAWMNAMERGLIKNWDKPYNA